MKHDCIVDFETVNKRSSERALCFDISLDFRVIYCLRGLNLKGSVFRYSSETTISLPSSPSSAPSIVSFDIAKFFTDGF